MFLMDSQSNVFWFVLSTFLNHFRALAHCSIDCKTTSAEGANDFLPTSTVLLTKYLTRLAFSGPKILFSKILCHHSLLINLYVTKIETLSLRIRPFLVHHSLSFLINWDKTQLITLWNGHHSRLICQFRSIKLLFSTSWWQRSTNAKSHSTLARTMNMLFSARCIPGQIRRPAPKA